MAKGQFITRPVLKCATQKNLFLCLIYLVNGIKTAKTGRASVWPICYPVETHTGQPKMVYKHAISNCCALARFNSYGG